jgi:Na+-driven multidrug efflux pump
MDSLSPAIGYNWGAEDYSRVKKIAETGFASTALVGLISTSILFFFPGTIAALFANAEDVRLLEVSTHAIRIFCFAYVFRWLAVMTQSFLSAVQKPAQATIMSVGTALVFPVILLGALWHFELNGIWFNFVGVNGLAAILAVVLLTQLAKEIKRRQSEKDRGLLQ